VEVEVEIEANEVTVPAGIATAIDYKVFDENGLDITSITTVFSRREKELYTIMIKN